MDARTLDGVGLTTLQNFWIKHARQCEELSGGTVKEYALKNGLEPQDLYRWRSWFRKNGLLKTSKKVFSEIPNAATVEDFETLLPWNVKKNSEKSKTP
ncbi:MAG: transposase domain-containing protein [Magnetococcales bacterium]|nr:transposase domain-containing protein [Magnetococcales bacterium]